MERPDRWADRWIILSPGAVWHAVGHESQPGERVQVLCGIWLEPTAVARSRDDEPPDAEACDVCHVLARQNYDPSALMRITEKIQRKEPLTPEEERLHFATMASSLGFLAWGGAALIDKIFKSNIVTPEFRQRVGEIAADMMQRTRSVGRNQRRIDAEHDRPKRLPPGRRKPLPPGSS